MGFGSIEPRNGVNNDEFMPFMILGTNAHDGDLLFSPWLRREEVVKAASPRCLGLQAKKPSYSECEPVPDAGDVTDLPVAKATEEVAAIASFGRSGDLLNRFLR